MSIQRVDRRHVLTAAGAGLVVAVGLGGTAAATPSSSEGDGAVTGGYLITRHDNGFVAVFWAAILDPHGRSVGTARIRATGQVNGDKISGSYTDVVFVGNQQQHGSGTFRGRRIEAD